MGLPEKLYFYHSTAECFFAGAFALQAGYFIWIYNGGPNRFTTIGLGFVFGVGSILLFFVSSVLMALDDIMRSCRTSILYTDEMASIYACPGPAAASAPAVSAAAKAFASAGTSGKGAATTSANNNDDNNNINNNDKNNSNHKDNKMNKGGSKEGADASKGSEMVTGLFGPQKDGTCGGVGGGGGYVGDRWGEIGGDGWDDSYTTERRSDKANTAENAHMDPRLVGTTAATAAGAASFLTTTTTTTTMTKTMTTTMTTSDRMTATYAWGSPPSSSGHDIYDVPTDFYLLGRIGEQPSMAYQPAAMAYQQATSVYQPASMAYQQASEELQLASMEYQSTGTRQYDNSYWE